MYSTPISEMKIKEIGCVKQGDPPNNLIDYNQFFNFETKRRDRIFRK